VLASESDRTREKIMWKRFRRPLAWLFAMEAAVYLVGRFIEHRMTSGDESTDEFKVAAICNGKEFRSHAEHLRSGSVVAGIGGVDIDLRDATLDPHGARLDLNATMGGIQLIVPEEWAVEFESDTLAGGFQADVNTVDDLPPDAPRLHVHATTRMGGATITAER